MASKRIQKLSLNQKVVNLVSFGVLGAAVGVGIVTLSGCQKKAPSADQVSTTSPESGGPHSNGTDAKASVSGDHSMSGVAAGGTIIGEIDHAADSRSPASAENAIKQDPGLAQGTLATADGTAPLSPATLPVTAKEPDPCFTFEFEHKATAQHTSDEECSLHNNRISLTHAASEINRQSLCVKADDMPVAYAIEGNTVVLSNVAGPKTHIHVSYCLGKHQCKRDCTPPKDAFFDSVADEAAGGGGTGKDEVSAAMSQDLKKALRGGLDGSTFSAWEKKSETHSCAGSTESTRGIASRTGKAMGEAE